MHGHPWYGFGWMCLLSVTVALAFYGLMYAAYARLHRWEDVRTPARGMSAGLGLSGVLFYLALMLHIFR